MHAGRFACMLLGMWLAGSALATWITADSFHAARRILASHSPEFGVRLQSMGGEEARMMLAYPVRQQVGWWAEQWGDFEIAFGACFFLFLLLGTREGKITLAIALAPLAWRFSNAHSSRRTFSISAECWISPRPTCWLPNAASLKRSAWVLFSSTYCNSSLAEFWPCS